MKNEKLTEREMLKEAMDHLGESLAFLYETESREYHAVTFVVDSALKLATVIYQGDNILEASSDYTAYENMVYKRFQKELAKKKKAHDKVKKK